MESRNKQLKEKKKEDRKGVLYPAFDFLDLFKKETLDLWVGIQVDGWRGTQSRVCVFR